MTTAIDTNTAFAITATGKAFRVLSDGLYSDKITAVIRELGCNAYDSHVAAGKQDEPFLVTLPSESDPYFSVQDFGLGISDSDIYDIYTKYFTSTKTNNVELIGQLGLGSKSPFSLVREFFVESNHNGDYRKYRMYFDASDTPRVAMVDHKTTSQPNGVKVSFRPIDDDIKHFRYKAWSVFKWFATTPIVTCDNAPVEIENLTRNMKHSGWYQREYIQYSSQNITYALMGNIAYPLTAQSIKDIGIEFHHLLSLPLVIQFDMGAFEVSASRESIGYDDRSCENIRNRLQQVVEEYYYEIVDSIEAASSVWNARIARIKAFNNFADWGYTLKKVMENRKFYWNGIEINSKTVNIEIFRLYSTVDLGAIRTIDGDKLTLHRLKKNDATTFAQECTDHHIVVFDDIGRNSAVRIKPWFVEQKKTIKNLEITVFKKPNTGINWKALANMLGNPEVVYTSKMPAPPKKAREKKTEKLMLFKPYVTTSISACWGSVEYDFSKGGFYVDHLERRPVDSEKRVVNLKDIISVAKQLGIIEPNVEVYAAKGYNRLKITKTRNWINIVDYIRKKVKKELPKIKDDLDAIATRSALENAKYQMGNEYWHSFSWEFRDPNSKMKEFIATFQELTSISAHGNNVTTKKLVVSRQSVYSY